MREGNGVINVEKTELTSMGYLGGGEGKSERGKKMEVLDVVHGVWLRGEEDQIKKRKGKNEGLRPNRVGQSERLNYWQKNKDRGGKFSIEGGLGKKGKLSGFRNG